MCFSAPVSFVTSAALTASGVASVPLAKTRARKCMAAVPILFAVQQFIEGMQWLVTKPGMASDLLTYGFLLFAFFLWPIYIPFAISLNEKSPHRRKILRFLCLSGGLLVLFLLALLLTYPVHAVIYGASIRYDLNSPTNTIWTLWYIFVVLGSFFVSSDTFIRLFGLLTGVSIVVSAVFFNWVFTSVWCFFAAVLSSLIYLYLRLTAR